jgi:hypothetical protein
MFSVSDYIKAMVQIRNNPLLYSLPLNLDAFTGFYISTAEQYDTSDGYTIASFESAFVDNSFEGYAVAGVLPFKNRYSGQYSEYVYTSGNPAQWLNTLTTVIGVVDRYFDVSFIKNISGPFTLLIDKWANDYRYETEEVAYTDSGIGVYRIPLTFVSAYDQFCIRAQKPEVAARPASNLIRILMTNCAGATWTTGSPPTITLSSLAESGFLQRTFATNAGIAHGFTYEIAITGSGATPLTKVTIAIVDDDCNVIVSDDNNHFVGGTITGTITLTPPVDATRIAISIQNLTIPSSKTYSFDDFDFLGTPGSPAADITEELCIDIYEVCGFDDAAVIQPTGARRLLEDGGFRLLEE